MIVPLSDDAARVDGRAPRRRPAWSTSRRASTGRTSEQYDTVGGLVYHHIGGVPEVGDAVGVDGLA